MERHADFPSFRCVAVTLPDDPGNAPSELRTQTGGDQLTVIGFAYGFHGTSGQWWHDLVRSALAAAGGRELAQTWLGDSFEVAEVHVHPGYQGRGVGRAMVLRSFIPGWNGRRCCPRRTPTAGPAGCTGAWDSVTC